MDQLFAAVAAPHDALCIDFKGWFQTGDGGRSAPFTVTDAQSRYILGLRIMSPTTALVQAHRRSKSGDTQHIGGFGDRL